MSSQKIVDLRNGRRTPREEPRRPVARTGERRSPLRSRRRKVRAAVAVTIFLLTAGIVYGINVVSHMSRFTIQSIVVAGQQKISTESVIAALDARLNDRRYHFLSNKNIFLYPKSALEKAVVMSFPRAASVKISRGSVFSTTLKVEVQERAPFAKWCEPATDVPGTCYLADEHGFIFADTSDAGEVPQSGYIFTGGIASSTPIGATFAPGHLPGIVAMMKLLTDAGFSPQGAALEDERDFSINMPNGFFIKASFGEDATQLVRNLQLILTSSTLSGKEDSLDYIDLRFGNRVYYKLKGQPESPAQ